MSDPTLRSRLVIDDADAMHSLGLRLGAELRAGDLVVLTGELGAGKTTLTRGIGEGLGVRGPVTSPTFVIARLHPSLVGGPALLHADAYRLDSLAEIDDLDLDAELADCVTVVEWGEGLVESLSGHRLDVRITRTTGHPPDVDLGKNPENTPSIGRIPKINIDGGTAGGSGGGGGDARVVELAGFGRRWHGVDLSTDG